VAGVLVALAVGCVSQPVAVTGASGPAWSGGPKPGFVLEPTATYADGQVVIQFWVSRPTDVAVFIKDRDGTVVRHLAAGVLGPNAPEPLTRGTLGQSLTWDGLDDDGRPVPAGRYSVEVGLGLTVTYDRSLASNPRALGSVHGLALGPKGDLYVMSETGRDYLDGVFRVFTRDGEYVRTILPRSAGLPLSRAEPLGELALYTGERFPTSLVKYYGRRIYQVPIVTPEGDLIFTNGPGGGHLEGKRFSSVPWHHTNPRRLLRIAADGGAPKAGFIGPLLDHKGFNRALFSLAMGPDGMVYISGARHAVYRARWEKEAKPELFVGTPDEAGRGAAGLNQPCGIAFDAKGNLYVADRGNHRVAVFDRAGKWVGEIPVLWPRQLLVHPKTGAVYVAAGHKKYTLHKFAGLSAKGPLYSYDLRSTWPFLALDATAGDPAIFVANVDSRAPGATWRTKVLVRLVDDGKAIRLDRQLSDDERPRQPLLYGVDRDRELVYGNWPFEGWWRMNGRTGEVETFDHRMAPKANGVAEITAGRHGTVVTHVLGEMGRLDHQLKPLPFSATGTYIVSGLRDDCIRSFYGRDVTVAPNGDLYWIHERGGYAQPMRCSALNADGTLKKDSLIVFETGSPAAVRVDRKGCIYVIDHLKPLGQLVPDALADFTTIRRSAPYVHNYGSLLKFRPSGGRVRLVSKGAPKLLALKPGQTQFTAAEGRGHFVADGVLWSHFGVSCIRPARPRDGCQCWTPRFDLDEFARVFVPDELRSRVVVLDTNGNPILSFGRYGNPDDPGPDVPLADPRTVMVSHEAAYIGDMNNLRVARAAFSYRKTASCSVRVPGRAPSELARQFAEQGRIAARRSMLWLMNAEMRVADLRREVETLAPSVAESLDWDQLVLQVSRSVSAALANADDARAVLCVNALRSAPDCPQDELRALLGGYLAQGNTNLRLAVLWGLWGGLGGQAGEELLLGALKDETQPEAVRVTAAYVLLQRKDPAGVGTLLRAALSKDPVAYKMAETAIIKLVSKADFPVDQDAVQALSEVLGKTRGVDRRGRKRFWYLRRAAFLLLHKSTDRAGAESSLLAELRAKNPVTGKGLMTGNNLNRAVAGLGEIRSRKAVPELVFFIERGYRPNWRGGHADKAERFAAVALGKIADPAAVKPLTALLDSKTRGTAEQALRALTLMFDPTVPDDQRLVPTRGRLVKVRIDALPPPAAIRAAWDGFWKVNNDRYEWSAEGPPLKRRGGE